MRVLLLCLVACLLSGAVASDASYYQGLENVLVSRSYDLRSSQVYASINLTASNTGSQSAAVYHYLLTPRVRDTLAFSSFQVDGEEVSTSLNGEVVKQGDTEYALLAIELPSSLAPKDSVEIKATLGFYHALEPLPTAIPQDAQQLVVFDSTQYYPSVYPTKKQRTTIKLPGSTVESRTEAKPSSLKNNKLVYGPFKDVKPLTVKPLRVHFANNSPFLTATQLEREVEVSHWGNVAVEETWNIRHTGAGLKGPYHRTSYRQGSASPSVVTLVTQLLPVGARDLYYRDAIGNITSSAVREEANGVLFEMKPRFPLYGGWKIGFTTGYNLPAPYYLFTDTSDSSVHMLNLTFAVPMDGMGIEDFVMKVVLPEGSTDIQAHVPFPVDSEAFESKRTYLDTSGRPVLVLRKKNVVPAHQKFFQVTYRSAPSSMFREPLLLVSGWFALFALVMTWVRLDLSLKPVDADTESRRLKQIKTLLEEAGTCHERRMERYAGLKDSVASGKAVAGDRRGLFLDQIRSAQLAWTRVENEIKHLDSDIAFDMREVSRLESILRQLYERALDGDKAARSEFASKVGSVQGRMERLVGDILDV